MLVCPRPSLAQGSGSEPCIAGACYVGGSNVVVLPG